MGNPLLWTEACLRGQHAVHHKGDPGGKKAKSQSTEKNINSKFTPWVSPVFLSFNKVNFVFCILILYNISLEYEIEMGCYNSQQCSAIDDT